VVDFKVKRIEFDQQRVRLHVWDTAGQERYDSLSYKYYRGANGVVLVYDIAVRKSFEDITMWLENIRKNCHQEIHAVLVGNKCDLHTERQVQRSEGEAFAEQENMPFYETSAKDDVGVLTAFLELTRTIINVTSYPTSSLHPKYMDEKTDVKHLLCSCCS